ncbi:MAG: TonB-dependent receptor [Polyangiaceae bacterium]|nr:TonB-dependent receptor [Polyangiaceae bacterium]
MPRLDDPRAAALALGAFAALTDSADAAPTDPSSAPNAPIEIVVEHDASVPTSSRDPTAASTVIHRAALERPGASAAEVLDAVPGVQTRRTGADSDLATASLRGATAAQTPVYLAGVRLNDDVTGTADLGTVPLFMLHRVEIFRGHTPAVADRMGIGGAVLFEPRLPQGQETRAGQLLGSYGARSTWFATMTGNRRAGALVALRHDAAANDYGYVNDAGTRFDDSDDRRVERTNADHTTWNLWALGRYALGENGHVTLVYDGFTREQGVTGLSVVPAARSRARSARQLIAVSAEVPCSGSKHDGREPCRLQLVASGLAARTTLSDPDHELALGASSIVTDGHRFADVVRWRGAVSRQVTVTAGGEASVETLRLERATPTGAPYSLAARRTVTRPSASVTVAPVRSFEWLGLGALECHSTEGPTGGDTCGELEPVARSGLRVSPTRSLDLLANVGRTVRVPTLGERYGMAPLVRGNPELEPELGTSVDLGLRLHGSYPSGLGGFFEAFAFRRWVEGLVTYRQSFRQLVPFNLGAARLLGIELASEVQIRRVARLGATATLLDPRDRSPDRTLENDILPLQSRLVATSYLEGGTTAERFGIDRLSAGLRLHHRASHYQDPAGLIIVPHQTTVDLDAALLLLEDRLALRAALENLLDAEERDLIGFPLPGRTLSVAGELVLP